MKKSNKTRVQGCIHGLDSDDPKLPNITCHLPCAWRVNSTQHKNCSWVIFSYLATNGKQLTLRQVGDILGTTHETVRNAEASALDKLKVLTQNRDVFDDVNLVDYDFDMRSTKKAEDEATKELMAYLEDFLPGNTTIEGGSDEYESEQ